jgi:hypothetical protein
MRFSQDMEQVSFTAILYLPVASCDAESNCPSVSTIRDLPYGQLRCSLCAIAWQWW